MSQLFDREYEWFEVWHHWHDDPRNLAIVCKFRGDDAILLYSLADDRVWMRSPDYELISLALAEDEYSPVQGRVSYDDEAE